MPHSKAASTVLPKAPQLASVMAERIATSRQFTAQFRPSPDTFASSSDCNRLLPGSLFPARAESPLERVQGRGGNELYVCLVQCTQYIITAMTPFVKAHLREFERSGSEVGVTHEFR